MLHQTHKNTIKQSEDGVFMSEHDPRIVCWFSCGAASAVATKLAIADNAGRSPLAVAYTEVMEEHPDNRRFLADCEGWFGVPITVLRNEKYGASAKEVFRRERFLVSSQGAPCTRLLKRQMRVFFEEEDDVQVFGFTVEERVRAADFVKRNSYVNARFPLLDRGLSKADCLAIISDAGIDIPAMYKLGYQNNNCRGCVKGGMGYWNKIRQDFPDDFLEMARIEREIGFTILSDDDGPIWLDELHPNRGRYKDEPNIECSFFCRMAQEDLEKAA